MFGEFPDDRSTGLPAFEDNYIWLLRAGNSCAAVDPGDATPLLARTWRNRRPLWRHPRHPPPRRPRRRHRETVAHRIRYRFYGPVNPNRIAGVDHPLDGGGTLNLPALGLQLEVFAVPGTPAATSPGAKLGSGALFWRHAVRRRLRAPVRRHPGADAGVAGAAGGAAADDPGLLRPRIRSTTCASRVRSNPAASPSSAAPRDNGPQSALPASRRFRCACRPNSTPIPSCAGMCRP